MSILFINGSPNKNGNTVALSEQFLKGKNYQTLHLVDYKIYSYGQHFTDDQFDEVVLAMSKADTIVIGSPLYWHSMSGAVRNLLDRFYQHVDESLLKGKTCILSSKVMLQRNNNWKQGNIQCSVLQIYME